MSTSNTLHPKEPFVDPTNGFRLTVPAYRFLASLTGNANQAANGEVATPPGSGLDGGGPVSAGVTLAISPNGVENGMIRQALGTSVIGRFQNSTGNVADIQASADERVLSREGGQLAFRSFINGVSIGPSTAAPLVNTDLLIVTSDPPAAAASDGVAGTITWDSGFLYVCVSDGAWKRVAIATW